MTHLSLEEACALAQRFQNEGRVADAENLLRQIVAQVPNDAESRHQLGVIYARSGRFGEAAQMIRSAIELSPREVAYYANLGNVLQELGGVDEAIAAYSSALAIDPAAAIPRGNLGNALQRLGRYHDAIENYHQALRIAPDVPVFWVNLGNALLNIGRRGEAIDAYQKASELQPQAVDTLLALAAAQMADEQFEAAIETCQRVIAIDPSSSPARQLLGSTLTSLARPDDAIVQLRESIRAEPNRWQAWYELGGALRDSGDLSGSIEAYRKVLALQPDDAGAHYGLAWSLLQRGDYAEGFAEYEWRARLPTAPPVPALPRWDGSRGEHHRVILVTEQGFGDSLMAYRYLSSIRERVGAVIIQGLPALQRLFAEQPDACRVVSDMGSARPTSYFPMMSLPNLVGTRVDTIPATIPYLRANPDRVAEWRQRMPKGVRNIGLAWVGNVLPRYRSLTTEELAPLNQLEGVRFHSLQGGSTARQINSACDSVPIVDWSAELTDFAEVAALIANLDCIVTIDTAAAHLAGAMGKSTYVLLNYAPDWRWFSGRSDSPWYPTMRLFRQKRPRDWSQPVAELMAELRK